MPKENCMWPFGKYKGFPCALNHLTLEMKMCQEEEEEEERNYHEETTIGTSSQNAKI